MYNNIIKGDDKDSKFGEKKLKAVSLAFTILSHFILANTKPKHNFMTAKAELKLKKIDEVQKTSGKKTVMAPVYFKDEPLIDVKSYDKKKWTEKVEREKKTVKVPKTEPKVPKKPLTIVDNGDTVTVTREVARGKFMTFKKPVKYIISALLGYYCNDLMAIRTEGAIKNADYIDEKGKISKFIKFIASGVNKEKYFVSDVFGEERDEMNKKFNECDLAIDGFVKNEITACKCFSFEENNMFSEIFKNFLYALINFCTLFKMNKFSVGESLVYTLLYLKYSEGSFDFKIDELISALKKDCDTATIEMKKPVAVKTPKTTAPKKEVGNPIVEPIELVGDTAPSTVGFDLGEDEEDDY